jgi:hypothetical protein
MAIGTRRVTTSGKTEGVAKTPDIVTARERANRILDMQADIAAVEILRRPDRERSWQVVETIARNPQ